MTYQYECKEKSCRYSFISNQGMNDEPLKTCPQCDGELRRVITGGSGFILKGSGFYKTDNKG